MSTTYALNIGRHGIEKTVETTTIYGMLCRIRYSKDHPTRYDTQWFAHHGESESDRERADETGGLLHLSI